MDPKISFDTSITDDVINSTGPKASPRAAQVLGSLTQHLHDFCRENLITRPEFDAALEFVSIPQSVNLNQNSQCF